MTLILSSFSLLDTGSSLLAAKRRVCHIYHTVDLSDLGRLVTVPNTPR